MNTSNQNPYILPIAVVVAALVIAAAVIYGPQGASSGTVPQAGTGQQAPIIHPAIEAVTTPTPSGTGDPYIGNPNAPVTVTYWSDYQCPFCKQFDADTMGDLVKNYVDTGKIKIVFEDFQFLGPDSTSMALAARAVWETYPGKYFIWRETMYANQQKEDTGYATRDYILL